MGAAFRGTLSTPLLWGRDCRGSNGNRFPAFQLPRPPNNPVPQNFAFCAGICILVAPREWTEPVVGTAGGRARTWRGAVTEGKPPRDGALAPRAPAEGAACHRRRLWGDLLFSFLSCLFLFSWFVFCFVSPPPAPSPPPPSATDSLGSYSRAVGEDGRGSGGIPAASRGGGV